MDAHYVTDLENFVFIQIVLIFIENQFEKPKITLS